MIKLPHCAFYRENKETLANLVSLDLLVLMVSLWVLHSSIYKHTVHSCQQQCHSSIWENAKPHWVNVSIRSWQFLLVDSMWSGLHQNAQTHTLVNMPVYLFFQWVNKKTCLIIAKAAAQWWFCVMKTNQKVNHMLYSMIKNSEKESASQPRVTQRTCTQLRFKCLTKCVFLSACFRWI